MKPVPIVKQDFYDENRSLYGADTTIADYTVEPCSHKIVKRGDDLYCIKCHAGWIGLGRVKGIINS